MTGQLFTLRETHFVMTQYGK